MYGLYLTNHTFGYEWQFIKYFTSYNKCEQFIRDTYLANQGYQFSIVDMDTSEEISLFLVRDNELWLGTLWKGGVPYND